MLQLIISTWNATLEVPSLRPWHGFKNVVQLTHVCCMYIAQGYLTKNDIKHALPLCKVVS